MQTKCMKQTSTKTFDKFPALTLALQVVLKTVSFTGHSRALKISSVNIPKSAGNFSCSDTIELLLN